MAGQRVVPLAAALDHVTAAALDVSKTSSPGFAPFTVSDFALERAILVPDTTWLDVSVTEQLRGGKNGPLKVTLSQGNARSYAGTVTLGANGEQPAIKPLVSSGPLPMTLEDFYKGFTFHGPRLQGITRIDTLADEGVVGWVKGNTPADWVKEPLRQTWAIDPLDHRRLVPARGLLGVDEAAARRFPGGHRQVRSARAVRPRPHQVHGDVRGSVGRPLRRHARVAGRAGQGARVHDRREGRVQEARPEVHHAGSEGVGSARGRRGSGCSCSRARGCRSR